MSDAAETSLRVRRGMRIETCRVPDGPPTPPPSPSPPPAEELLFLLIPSETPAGEQGRPHGEKTTFKTM